MLYCKQLLKSSCLQGGFPSTPPFSIVTLIIRKNSKVCSRTLPWLCTEVRWTSKQCDRLWHDIQVSILPFLNNITNSYVNPPIKNSPNVNIRKLISFEAKDSRACEMAHRASLTTWGWFLESPWWKKAGSRSTHGQVHKSVNVRSCFKKTQLQSMKRTGKEMLVLF